jgi:hypothetical protein
MDSTTQEVTTEPMTADEVEALAEQLADDLRDGARLFRQGDLRAAEVRFEGVHFLASDLERECERQREAKEARDA